MQGDQRIEWIAIDQLKPYAGNARTHSNRQIKRIARSIAVARLSASGWVTSVSHEVGGGNTGERAGIVVVLGIAGHSDGAAEVAAADALIFAVPEYNFSLPGVLKNALEWLSRPPAPPADGKPCAVFGASVSPLGTARGQFHFRHVAVSLNMIMVNVPHVDINSAKAKFDAESRLTDQASLETLRQLVTELNRLTLQLCASKVR